MDAETKRDIEDIKLILKNLEQEEARLLEELEDIKKQKYQATERLKALSDDSKYQQEMLEMVYAQRHKK